MSRYNKYLQEIDERKNLGLNPKPIDDGLLLNEIMVFNKLYQKTCTIKENQEILHTSDTNDL